MDSPPPEEVKSKESPSKNVKDKPVVPVLSLEKNQKDEPQELSPNISSEQNIADLNEVEISLRPSNFTEANAQKINNTESPTPFSKKRKTSKKRSSVKDINEPSSFSSHTIVSDGQGNE